MVTVEERGEERHEDPLRFQEVRDGTGQLICRIAEPGIVEIKVRASGKMTRRGCKIVLVNIWDHLKPPPRQG